MQTNTIDDLVTLYEQTKMVGWDFSRLSGRMMVDDTPWDFDADCLAEMRRASNLVDLGTGGGERLRRLLAAVPPGERRVAATEGWAPNFPVAQGNLAPLGIDVVSYSIDHGQPLPFDDSSLDLVMSRHEAIDIGEAARVLVPGGRLLSQQVHGRDAEEIHLWFDEEFLFPDATPERYAADLEAAGMRVDAMDEWQGTRVFTDVEALVVYLALVPWDAPNFDVRRNERRLAELDANRPIRVSQRRFRVSATKR